MSSCPLCGGELKQVAPWEFLTCKDCNVLVDDLVTQPIPDKITELFLQLSPDQQFDTLRQLVKFVK